MERVLQLASGSAVVVFSISSCCMYHTVKRLFCEIGVNPAVYELDQDPRGNEIERALTCCSAVAPPFRWFFSVENSSEQWTELWLHILMPPWFHFSRKLEHCGFKNLLRQPSYIAPHKSQAE